MGLFQANDIRGVYGKNLTESHAFRLGQAFVSFLKTKEVVVGYDARLSSPSLSYFLMEGIRDQGANVIDVGLIDAPGFYFATAKFNRPGIYVTASHNPAEYNGFYVCKAKAEPINENTGLHTLGKLVLSTKKFAAKKRGHVEKKMILDDYVDHVLSFIKPQTLKGLRVAIDSGNGMGGLIAPLVYKRLPLSCYHLYSELDGSFPHHEPNPAVYSNLKDLARLVRKKKAHFGIAFDGDADRAGFVDENGKVIEGSIVGALVATYLLQKKKASIVYSSTSSRIVPEMIEQYGGKAICDKVGHTFIKLRMRKTNAVFGIENTGHYFFKDNWYADSGIITSLVMCQLYKQSGMKMSKLVEPYLKYYKAEDGAVPAVHPHQYLKEIHAMIKRLKPKKFNTYDGIHADMGSYWFSVRASHTEPLVRLSIEGESKKVVEQAKKHILSLLKEIVKK